MNRLLLASLALVLSAACGPIDLYVPVCHTEKGVKIPAAPIEVEGSFERSQQVDLREMLAKAGSAISEVQLSRIELTATSGIADWSWLEQADVAFATSADAPSQTLVHYVQPAEGVAGKKTLVLAAATTDVLPQLAAGPVSFVFDFTGQMPTTDWTVDVKVCAVATTPVFGGQTAAK